MNDIKTSEQLKDAIDNVDSTFAKVLRRLKRLEIILSPELRAAVSAAEAAQVAEMPEPLKPTGPPAKRPLTYKCSVCGLKGHNKRTCLVMNRGERPASFLSPGPAAKEDDK